MPVDFFTITPHLVGFVVALIASLIYRRFHYTMLSCHRDCSLPIVRMPSTVTCIIDFDIVIDNETWQYLFSFI